MNKAEELKQRFIKKWQPKHGISGTARASFNRQLNTFLDEYASEERKEHAKEFAYWIVMNQSKIKLGQRYYDFYEELYQDWLKQKEGKQ